MASEQDVFGAILRNTRYVNNPEFPPHGSINYDYDVFPEDKTQDLEELKLKTKKENEKYLYDHPEIGALISCFLYELLSKKPVDGGEFLASFFKRKDLKGMVKDTVDNTYEIHNKVRSIPKNTVDGGIDKMGSRNAYCDTIHAEETLNKKPAPCNARDFVP